MKKNKVFARKPAGIVFWYATRRRNGQDEIKSTYTVQDFTGLRYINEVRNLEYV